MLDIYIKKKKQLNELLDTKKWLLAVSRLLGLVLPDFQQTSGLIPADCQQNFNKINPCFKWLTPLNLFEARFTWVKNVCIFFLYLAVELFSSHFYTFSPYVCDGLHGAACLFSAKFPSLESKRKIYICTSFFFFFSGGREGKCYKPTCSWGTWHTFENIHLIFFFKFSLMKITPTSTPNFKPWKMK